MASRITAGHGRWQTEFDNIKNMETEAYADAPYSSIYPYIESYHDKCSLHVAFAQISESLTRSGTDTGTLLVQQYGADKATATAFADYQNAVNSRGNAPPTTVETTTKQTTSTTTGATVAPAVQPNPAPVGQGAPNAHH